tara:strand:+ start:985 stop:1224 length:240 start_codon:yes stop_codon:yes gene_type:complete
MFATSTTRYARARRARGFLSFVSSSRATFSLGARAMFEPSSTHPPMDPGGAMSGSRARRVDDARRRARVDAPTDETIFF